MCEPMQSLIPAWENGTLQPLEKLDVHRRGLRHLAISVFVMKRGRVLLQRRALCKYHTPGLWANTCCTHPHWGEESAACAARRLHEELGISGLALQFRDRVEYRADVGGGLTEHEVVDIFTAEAGDDMPLAPNPDEVCETAWASLPDLAADTVQNPARYTPWLRIYLAEHQEAIFGMAEGA